MSLQTNLNATLYVQTIEGAEQAILTVNPEGVVTSWNASAQRLYGYTAAAIVGRTVMGLVASGGQLGLAQALRRVLSGQRLDALVMRHVHQFGDLLNVRVQPSALSDADGAIVGVALFITPRNPRAELRADPTSASDLLLENFDALNAEYQATRAQLELLLESHADLATLTLDAQGRITAWSQTAQRLFGGTLDQTSDGVFHPLEPMAGLGYSAALLDLARARSRVDVETLLGRADGTAFWARLSLRALRDEHARLSGYIAVVHDLRRPELEGRVQDAPLATDAILITDADLDDGPRIVYANSAFSTLCGYDLDALIGQTPRVLQGPLTDRAMLARLRATLARGGVFVAETVNYRRDARRYRVRWQIVPLTDALGVVTYFLSVQQEAVAGATFSTVLHEIVRVADHLGARVRAPLCARLETLGGAGTLLQLVALRDLDGVLTLDHERRVQFRAGRVVAVEHPHLTGRAALLDINALETGAFVWETDASALDASLDIAMSEVVAELARSRLEPTPPTSEHVNDDPQGLIVLHDADAALAFARGIGLTHFKAGLERDGGGAERLVLRGRGFKIVAMRGTLDAVPPELLAQPDR
jgi:PAS domain S-box-containing protein